MACLPPLAALPGAGGARGAAACSILDLTFSHTHHPVVILSWVHVAAPAAWRGHALLAACPALLLASHLDSFAHPYQGALLPGNRYALQEAGVKQAPPFVTRQRSLLLLSLWLSRFGPRVELHHCHACDHDASARFVYYPEGRQHALFIIQRADSTPGGAAARR